MTPDETTKLRELCACACCQEYVATKQYGRITTFVMCHCKEHLPEQRCDCEFCTNHSKEAS